MYDKIKFYSFGGCEDVSHIPPLLSDVKETVRDERTYYEGLIGSMEVHVKPSARNVFILGSLPKFLNGNNLYPVSKHSTAEALQKLSDALSFDVASMKVSELEFGISLPTTYPPSCYLSRYGTMPDKHKVTQETTVYYMTKGHKDDFYLYDKVQEIGRALPRELRHSNVLRMEMRLRNGVASTLERPFLCAGDLPNRDVYNQLKRMFTDKYRAIRKLPQTCFSFPPMKTAGQAEKGFTAYLLASMPNPAKVVEEYMEIVKAQGHLDRQAYGRLKRSITQSEALQTMSDEDPLLQEIEDAFASLVEQAS